MKMTTNKRNKLIVKLEAKTKNGADFVKKHGFIYGFVKRFDSSIKEKKPCFVVRIESVQTNEMLNVNLENDKDFHVLFQKI